jgi:putative ABC transport system permease protein
MIFIRNMIRHKVRSLMTMFGVAVGISIYVAIAAVTNNLEQETAEVMKEYDTDITILSKDAPSPLHSRIRSALFADLKAIFGDAVEPMVLGALREPWNSYAMIIGIQASLAPRFALVEGKAPPTGSRDVMAGVILARSIGLRVGDSIPLGEGTARITGIFSMGNSLVDGAVVSNMAEVQRLLGQEDQINLVMLRLRNKDATKQVALKINQRFPRLHALPTVDFVGNIRLFRTIATFTRVVALVSFLGSCLVVTNTLLMAVAERTGEFGILMAVGWRPWLVLRMILAESLTLCLCGALLGNGLALLILKILNNSRAIGFGWIPVTIAPGVFFISLGVTLVMVVISMLWPVFILYRMSPVEALRHE